jgi:PIN domain nuclease of toxin-antitoxin system
VILLDTQVVLWLFLAPEKLSNNAREAILRARVAGERIGCSPVSLYEIANAARRRRLHLHTTTEEFTAAIAARIELIPLTAGIAICAGELPEPFHGDPMDRLIAATAIVEKCTLITADSRIRAANACKALW